MSDEDLGMKDYVIGCALALKMFHSLDGPCTDKKCTICPMLTKIGEMLVDGTLESDVEVKLLRSRLTIAEEALRRITEDSKTGTVSAQTFHEALNYLRSINTIAREGLKRMEEVRN